MRLSPALGCCLLLATVPAAGIHVAPTGKDVSPGTLGASYRDDLTIARSQ